MADQASRMNVYLKSALAALGLLAAAVASPHIAPSLNSVARQIVVISPPPVMPTSGLPPVGPTYYVRTDGSNSNTGLANTAGSAFLTIDWCADHAVAGDTCRVQAGTFQERVSPAVSGTAGNPITFIADGAVTFCGADIPTNKGYLRFIGFTIDTDAGCTKSLRAIAVGGTHIGLEFWNNTFRDASYTGIGSGAYTDVSSNTVVIGNTFTSIGDSGSGSAVTIRGENNLIAYNNVDGCDPDAFVVDGNHDRWLNNYIHNVVDAFDRHSDIFQAGTSFLGFSDNLFEANLAIGNGTLANEHGLLLNTVNPEICSPNCGAINENLFRWNVWHDQSGGIIGVDRAEVTPITNTREVYDTLVNPQRTAPTAAYANVLIGPDINGYFYNTLFHQAWGASVTTNVQAFYTQTGGVITGADYNLAYDPDGSVTFTTPWTSQAHPQSNVNPAFTSVGTDDFTIGVGSGARDVGGPLTTASGGGTGTTFNVASGGGGFFRGPNTNITTYGGNLTQGDVITVGTDVETVVSVSGDAITVTPSFTWVNGDPVYLGNDTTPDIGALPYKAGGYTLTATYAISNSVATITPNDANLVRFVICYRDGIPMTVDSTSPFTCPVGGAFQARVYPKFSSKTLWAVATP